jgi:sodium/proline symporter
VGLLGRSFLAEKLTDKTSELVFVNMVRAAFDWIGGNIGLVSVVIFMTGLLLSAILAASMSTADSQLLASASAFASDLYKPLFRKNASDREMLWAGRIVVVVIAIAAFFIASSPKCAGLMGLVSCAWGAFGAAFGPVVIMALYSKRTTWQAALVGMIVGTVVMIAWYLLGLNKYMYEILPGFVANIIVIIVLDFCIKQKNEVIIKEFDEARQELKDAWKKVEVPAEKVEAEAK